MQRQRSAFGSFPEAIDIDQGSIANNAGMSQQSSLNNILNPLESRLSNNAVSSSEAACFNSITHDVQGFSGWNSGESSSRLGLPNQMNDDAMKIEERWPSSAASHVAVPRLEERRFEQTNIIFPGRANQVRNGPLFMRGSSSSHVQPNPNSTLGRMGDVGNAVHGTGAVLGPNRFNPGGLEIGRTSPTNISSDDVGTSSGSSGYAVDETNGGSGPSLGSWGLSCKRRALEGTSGHSYSSGSSSGVPQTENVTWGAGFTCHGASSSLSLSTPLRSAPSVSPPEQLNPRLGFGMRGVTSDAFPSSSNVANGDQFRNFGRRITPGHQQEGIPFNLSTTGGPRRSGFWPSQHSSRPVPFSDSLDLRPTASATANASAAQVQPHNSLLRNPPPFLWNGSSSSRSGSPSSSVTPGERGVGLREEANLRSISRNSADHPMFGPATELRNMAQDPSSWSLATGNMSTSSSIPSSRIGPSSSIHPLPTPGWIPHPNQPSHNQRFPEFPPWSLFPSVDPEGGHSGHFPSLSSGPPSSQETGMSSGSNSQGHNLPFQRSAFLAEGQGDEALGMPRSLRALAADIEGRHRLISEIRQVLNAIRRGENLRVEDYMLFDPILYHGMAEMHDRHRDMRLDVDNMSYEELLALEERIGDVSTGLSEENILKLMKQQKYVSITTKSPTDLEPCCICQEVYADGDDLGMLDCGHEFHTNCIKQWLMQKNLCPICKMTALLA
ncbi:hypothetical protein Tsubulata_007312 [Turnera subulata]|uniref:RING-type E3 ubiquitin transferase n=1 Tax=Turnera subulata TaxID=218843 RepID=A0A9Q0FTK0_9ROSI|nr:hypothetical protein Tsubulata_007312 [Turnera subulata]